MKPAQRRQWVDFLIETFGVSISKACEVAGLSRGAYYYAPKRPDDSDVITGLLALVERHPRWGFSKLRKRLRRLGHRWNHKRIYRVYCELKLNMRRKAKRRLPTRNPAPLAVPSTVNYCWSMDFMSDALSHGYRFRTFNVVDDWNREILAIDVNGGITAERVIQTLDRVAAWRGYPAQIRVDNGPEFTSAVFEQCAQRHGVRIEFIQRVVLIKTVSLNGSTGPIAMTCSICICLKPRMKFGKSPMTGSGYITKKSHMML